MVVVMVKLHEFGLIFSLNTEGRDTLMLLCVEIALMVKLCEFSHFLKI